MQELKLRPYQQKDIAFMHSVQRAYNTNEPGLGKTVETLSAAKQMGYSTLLIVSPKIGLGVWRDEALKWFDDESVIYVGTQAKRRKLWQDFTARKVRILITNPKLLAEVVELSNSWDIIIADEVHTWGLLNPKTAAFKNFEKFRSRGMFLLTGTPIRRGPQDMFGPLHLLQPKHFPSYWGFVNRYCIVINNGFGKEIMNRPKDVLEFNSMIKAYMIRNLKKDVLPELPDKIRQVIPIQLEGAQLQMYNDLVNQMFIDVPGGKFIIAANAAVLVLRLRQMLVTPQLFGSMVPGGALEALPELIETEFDAGRSVAICTPFRQAVPYILKVLDGMRVPHLEIHGEIKEMASDVAKKFQDLPFHRKAIVYTIKSGASFTAHAASTAFFIGYEWSADQNKQAEDRLHRIGQKNSVHIKYLLYEDTVDASVMARLDEKQMAENWILTPEVVLKELKKTQSQN